MSKIAVEKLGNTYSRPMSAYDPDCWNKGLLIEQRTDSSPNFLGPIVPAIVRPMESGLTTPFPGFYPHAIRWANKEGYYSTGTVAVSGTAVSGTNTFWKSTGGVPINAKIGFGTTNPASVTTWYTIQAIASDSSITLSSTAGVITAGTSFVIDEDYKIDWVFLADGSAAAAATRRTQLFTFNRNSGAWGLKGSITNTTPATTGNQTVRTHRVTLDDYTVGTVAVSGTAVTGTNTLWITNRMCVGCRIGFGSTDRTQIDTWYYITAIGAETGITINTSAGTIGAGASYIIEDLRIVTITTNATTTNGGINLTKGIGYHDFTTGAGTTISAAVATDLVKAVYWLKDAATQTNVTTMGCGIEPKTDWLNQTLWVIDYFAANNVRVFKYNIRKALTLASGADSTTLLLQTGNNTITGVAGQLNNCRYGTLNHGPASGVPALYFTAPTRVYCAPISGLTAASTTIIAYSMTEVPAGGTSTYAVTGAIQSVEIADSIDRLFVMSSGATGFKSYITQYYNGSTAFDYNFMQDTKLLQQSLANTDFGVVPGGTLSSNVMVWSEGGLTYMFLTGTTAATHWGYAVPIGADWAFAATSGARLISPQLLTPNCNKYSRFFSIRDKLMGTDAWGTAPEPARWYYRTTGISDNTGAWNLISDTNANDLSGVAAAASIQFMAEFRVISNTLVPGRVVAIGVIYDDLTTDSHFQPSVGTSSITSKYFSWRFSTAFGSVVPALRIRLFDASSGSTLLDDTTTASASGVWTKSTDGSTFGVYNTTDLGNLTTYVRYTPTSLADNIRVRALLTLS